MEVVSSCVSVVVVFSVVSPSSEVWVEVVVSLSSLIVAPYPRPQKGVTRRVHAPISPGVGTRKLWQTWSYGQEPLGVVPERGSRSTAPGVRSYAAAPRHRRTVYAPVIEESSC